jgi:unsaturated chondroitin disaccharide hydrolase
MQSKVGSYVLESLESRQLFTAGAIGLQATYYDNTNFIGAKVSRVDPQINFNFGTKSPIKGIAADTFSVRWTGLIKASFSEAYTFKIVSDDGTRLWIAHKPVISSWAQTGKATLTSAPITLTAGKRYDIQLEYLEKTGSASVQFYWSSASTPQAIVPTTVLSPAKQNLKSKIDHAIAFAQDSLTQTLADLAGNTSLFPSITTANGKWSNLDAHQWTSGFFAGALWQMHKITLGKSWRLRATSYTTPIAASKGEADDSGFRFDPSFWNLYNSTHMPADKQTLIDAATAKIATFSGKVGMFKTLTFIPSHSGNPVANFMVLLDESMDMELIYDAAKLTGNQSWIEKANAHLAKMIQTMIRPDGGTIQLGYFNGATGGFVSGETKQGLKDTSTWSRGQAWMMYSLTNAYEQTGRADFLAAAKKVSNYYIAHLPPDYIPYWDFNATITSTTPRDSSAAATAASALLKLASLIPGTAEAATYKAAAENTLSWLCSPKYLAEGTASHGILLHGARWVAKGTTDNSLIYGDYYFLEALQRYGTLKFA